MPRGGAMRTNTRNSEVQIEQQGRRRNETMSELAKRESAPIFTDGWDDTAAEAESRVIRGSLLKFSEGRWTIGTENEAVKEGRQLVAMANAAAWVKWQGGKPVEYRVREPG